MATLAHHVDTPNDTDLITTTLLDVAAALETRVRDAESCVQTLHDDLQRLRQQQAQTRNGILAIRRAHRLQSHAHTARLIKHVLLTAAGDQDSRFSFVWK